METKVRLLYKSYMTYFHTSLPVYFYGMPNGKVYCIYARYDKNNMNNTKLEFVFGENEIFTYNYHSHTISAFGTEVSLHNFKELVDQPGHRIKKIKIYDGLQSYAEAQSFLNENRDKMIYELHPAEA